MFKARIAHIITTSAAKTLPTAPRDWGNLEHIMSNTHNIEISIDNDEGEQFAEWLNAQGHTAKVGNSTGDYIDGVWTSSDADANETMNALWSQYCNSPEPTNNRDKLALYLVSEGDVAPATADTEWDGTNSILVGHIRRCCADCRRRIRQWQSRCRQPGVGRRDHRSRNAARPRYRAVRLTWPITPTVARKGQHQHRYPKKSAPPDNLPA